MSTNAKAISLNTDLGEGYGAWRIADDEALLALVTDANLACGFHAGDPDIMRSVCRIARSNGVGVGGQVGFLDIRGFGRRFIDLPPETMTNDLVYQVGALAALARIEGVSVSYVKLHGALYHAAVARKEYAEAVVTAITACHMGLPLMCQPHTPLAEKAAGAGLRILREGYLDRAYQADGLLVPRGRPGALITDVDVAVRRAVQLAVHGEVETIDGRTIAMAVDTLCIHSDSPGAVELARAVRRGLEEAGVELASCSVATA